MNARDTRRAAWTIFGTTAVLSVTASVLGWKDQGVAPLIPILVAGLGTLILVRSGNRLGWLFDIAAAGALLSVASETYLYLHATTMRWLPGAGYAAVLYQVADVFVVVAFALVLLWFPTGRPPSKRWEPIAWLIMVSAALAVLSSLLRPGTTDANFGEDIVNPLGVPSLARVASVLGQLAAIGFLVGAIACVVSVIIRFRRSRGEERQQLRWLVAVSALATIFFGLAWLNAAGPAPDWIGAIGWIGFILSIALGIPAAVTIAVLRYHLYDIDLVISKTIVYAILVVFIGAVYVAIVVGIRLVLGLGAGNLGLSTLATGVVAVTFQPVRDRVQRFANRLVYGHRATPYEVLTRFSERVGSTYATEDVLPRTVRVIAEGVKAEHATIWLRLADELRLASSWPQDGQPEPPPVPSEGDELPDLDAQHVAPVRYRNELLGAIAVDKPRGEPLTPEERSLVDDLAAQAGVVVSNVRLTADLEARLDVITRQAAELQASSQRIVVAQDEERRRLERNIHDGAQQHLVALAVKLRLARSSLTRDPERARAMLKAIGGQVDDALDTLRALALGIYPPLLEDEGVVAALASRYAASALPVWFQTDGIGRYPLDMEAAVYFAVLEALQNAAKYAEASSIRVAFSERDGSLAFEVQDDGVGFDTAANGGGTGLVGMRDRLAVLGGDVVISSAPGHGTAVSGQVPTGAGVGS